MVLGNINLPSLDEMAWEFLATTATIDLIRVIYGQLTEKVKLALKNRALVTEIKGYYHQFQVRTGQIIPGMVGFRIVRLLQVDLRVAVLHCEEVVSIQTVYSMHTLLVFRGNSR